MSYNNPLSKHRRFKKLLHPECAYCQELINLDDLRHDYYYGTQPPLINMHKDKYYHHRCYEYLNIRGKIK